MNFIHSSSLVAKFTSLFINEDYLPQVQGHDLQSMHDIRIKSEIPFKQITYQL
jgi:hypothetical protein